MEATYFPPRQRGLIFHGISTLLLIAGSAFGLSKANQTDLGLTFVLYLVLFLGLALPVPLLAYRAYALLRGTYQLRPDGIRLTWGLRTEEIPMEEVLWISPDDKLERPLPLPKLRWPGAVMGTRRIGKRTAVEYMAVRSRNLIVIATPDKMYAISPEDSGNFLRTFQRLTEIGNIYPIQPRSIYPTFLLGSVWANRAARLLISAGLVLSLGLLIWINVSLPSGQGVQYRIESGPNDDRLISTSQLLLLPITNAVFFLIDLLMGLFFYRRPERHPLAYLLWGSSILTSILFFAAIYFILQN